MFIITIGSLLLLIKITPMRRFARTTLPLSHVGRRTIILPRAYPKSISMGEVKHAASKTESSLPTSEGLCAPWNVVCKGTGANPLDIGILPTPLTSLTPRKAKRREVNSFSLGMATVHIDSHHYHPYKEWMPFITWNRTWLERYPMVTSFDCKVADLPKVVKILRAYGYKHNK